MTSSRSMSRHPFQMWALLAFVVTGAATLIGPDPQSLTALLPHVALLAWAGTLLFGGVLGFIAAAWRDPVTALLLERAGLIPIGCAAIAYGIGIEHYAHARGTASASLAVAIGFASLWRVGQVSHQLKVLRLIAPREE